MAYDFNSVGAAMSGGIESFIDKQRELKRQALLDTLNQQNVESEISARAENTRSMAEQRRMSAQVHQENINKILMDRFHTGHNAGDVLSGLDPELMKLLQSNGEIETSTPEVSTGEAFQDPATGEWQTSPQQTTTGAPRSVFRGTSDQQTGLQRQLAARELAKDPNISDQLAQWLKVAPVTGDIEKGVAPPAGVFDSPHNMYIMDEGKGTDLIQATDPVTHKPIQSTGTGNPIVTRSRPPQGGMPFIPYGVGPGGIPMILNKKTGTWEPAGQSPTPDGQPLPFNPAPTPGSQNPSVSPIRQALAALAKAQNSGVGADEAAKGLWAEQSKIINQRIMNPALKQAAMGILGDPQKDTLSVPDLIKRIQGTRPLSPMEITQLHTTLNEVLGRDNAPRQ